MSDDFQKFANDRFLRTVDATLLHRFLARHSIDPAHFDAGLLLADHVAGRRALAEFLRGPKDRCPPSLTADLHRIAKLDGAAGMDVLLQEAIRLGVVLVPDEAKATAAPRNVALRAFVDHSELFEKAEDALDFLQPLAVTEFVAPEEGIEPDLGPARIEALQAQARALFEADLRGDFCRIGTHQDGDEVHLCIRHGAPLTTTEVVEDGDEHIRSYREIEKAVLAYSAIDGRLQVWGCAKARRADIAELFADVILGRPGLFKDEDAQRLYTLEPVERSAGAFTFRHAHAPEIAEVRIYEAQVNRLAVNPRTGRQRTVRSYIVRDTEGQALQALHASLPGIVYGRGWQLAHLVIKIVLRAPGRRQPVISVKIKPPQTVSFPRQRHQQLVMALLRRNDLVHDRESAATAVAAE